MELEEIYSFLSLTAERHKNCWDLNQLSKISNQRVPDFIMGGQGSLLRADAHLLWSQWFLESICDPDNFAKIEQSYGLILEAVKSHIPNRFSDLSQQDCKDLIKYIADLIDKEVQRRQSRTRPVLSQDDKKDLWDIFSPEQRCWICGSKFTQWSENRFLGSDRETEPQLPKFIDYMTLHGLTPRDITIEVDHAVPFSQGGREGDNLRLACGWCNSRKSDRVSLYDVSLKARKVEHPKLGQQSIPHPFWIVRLLSVRKRCEYEGGCNLTVDNSQLTVIQKYPQGVMNPKNLKVTCLDHDPLGSSRFVSRQVAEKMRLLRKQ